MKLISIIAEYNPFHNGHAYQLRKARQEIGMDSAVMIAMSGCFTQRGEPAFLDKWSRTRMALKCGVDLVLEIPFAFACASAERFAEGGVRLLEATGLNSHLVFGSECGDLGALDQLAGLLYPETPLFKDKLHDQLALGLSFPAARQTALAMSTGREDLAALLDKPNNILAVEYLKALRKTRSQLQPVTIRRQGADYSDANLPDSCTRFASASALRETVRRQIKNKPANYIKLIQDLSFYMPAAALAEMLERIQKSDGPVFYEDLGGTLLTLLRRGDSTAISHAAGMNEGLAQRLISAAARPSSDTGSPLDNLFNDTDTRRFTRTRIQRSLIALLTGLNAEDLQIFDLHGGPQYIRVLGFSRRGRSLLKMMRRLAVLPVITRASDFLSYQDPVFKRQYQLDLVASDLWGVASGRSCGHDFDTPILMR